VSQDLTCVMDSTDVSVMPKLLLDFGDAEVFWQLGAYLVADMYDV